MATHRLIREHINESLGRWEPRIRVEAVEVDADRIDPQAAIATINYRLVATQIALERVSLAVSVASGDATGRSQTSHTPTRVRPRRSKGMLSSRGAARRNSACRSRPRTSTTAASRTWCAMRWHVCRCTRRSGHSSAKSDPGVTLVELFAFLTESLLYRANRVPEVSRLKFLRPPGVPLAAATPARGLVAFRSRRGDARSETLPAGSEVRAGEIVFPHLGSHRRPAGRGASRREVQGRPQRCRQGLLRAALRGPRKRRSMQSSRCMKRARSTGGKAWTSAARPWMGVPWVGAAPVAARRGARQCAERTRAAAR